MRRFGLLLVVIALLAPLPALAQDLDCDAEELRPWLENYLAWRNAGVDVMTTERFGDDPILFLLVLHDMQTEMDGVGRPACADPLMFETYRSFHRFEQAMLCLRMLSTECMERLDAAEELPDVDDLLALYVSVAGLTEDEVEELRPEGWDAEAYLTRLGLVVSTVGETAQASDAPQADNPKGGRSAPYQSGEWASFSEGRVRVMPTDNDYQSGYYAPAPGMRHIAIPIEWECYQEVENEICHGSLWAKYVSPDGLIVSNALVYEAPLFGSMDMEGYSGAVLTGNTYFEVPQASELGQLRLELDGEHVFFELVPAE